MKIHNMTISKYILCIIMSFTLFSCEDDNVGEFVLTGNVEHLIPDGSYDLRKTIADDGQQIVFTPKFHSQFEYWGLALRQVEYYMDDALYEKETQPPFELMISGKDVEAGGHKLVAKMTVAGEACDDVILEKECVFYKHTDGIMSENPETPKSRGDFYINYNYVTKGDELVIIPELLVDRSSEGCEIDKVDYYWDGMLISTSISSPFGLRYRVEEEIGSAHDIRVAIAYHDNFSQNLTCGWSYSKYTICSSDDYMGTMNIKSNRSDYKNGETVSLIAKLFRGPNVKEDFEVRFYFDDQLIGKSASFPYTLDYKLEKLPIGSHTIKGIMSSKGDGSTSNKSIEETIIITE